MSARGRRAVERSSGDEESERRVESAGETEDQAVDAGVREPLHEAGGLNREDLFRPAIPLGVVARNERGRVEAAAQRHARVRRQVDVHDPPVHRREREERVAEARGALPVQAQVLDVHVGDQVDPPRARTDARPRGPGRSPPPWRAQRTQRPDSTRRRRTTRRRTRRSPAPTAARPAIGGNPPSRPPRSRRTD